MQKPFNENPSLKSTDLLQTQRFTWRGSPGLRPSGAGGQRGHQFPPKFSVDLPFLAKEPFKCALFERSNKKCT